MEYNVTSNTVKLHQWKIYYRAYAERKEAKSTGKSYNKGISINVTKTLSRACPSPVRCD